MDWKNLCRLCAEFRNSETDVFCFTDRTKLEELIMKYLSIEISNVNSELPSHVCEVCHSAIMSFEEFARKCGKAQIILGSLAQHHVLLDEALLESVKTEFKEDDLTNVKVELSEDVTVKTEDNSDDYNDNDDFIPISEYISRKKLKRKSLITHDETKKKKCKRGNSTKIKKVKSKRKADNYNDDIIDIKFEPDIDISSKSHSILNSPSFIKFICHMCSVEFPSWQSLKSHSRKDHNSLKPKVLCICDKYLCTSQSIRRHILNHDTSSGIKCPTCDKCFATEKAMEVHSSVHLPKDKCTHVCSQCPKRFATSYSLKLHEKIHISKELRYVHACELCGVKFTSVNSVKAHISAVHDKSRPFVCDVCGHAFNNKGNLQGHRLTHSEEKMFRCSKCSKRFKTRGLLQRHLDSHGGTSYKCTQCPALLNSRRTLRVHMYIHEDRCRFICAFCNKGYKRKKALKCHMNLHTGERPYSCPWCSRTFADNSNCRIHKRRMHPNELANHEAIHGSSQTLVKADGETGENRVIYNTMFKTVDIKPIVMPRLDINLTSHQLVPETI